MGLGRHRMSSNAISAQPRPTEVPHPTGHLETPSPAVQMPPLRQSLHQNYQFPWQLRGPHLRELIQPFTGSQPASRPSSVPVCRFRVMASEAITGENGRQLHAGIAHSQSYLDSRNCQTTLRKRPEIRIARLAWRGQDACQIELDSRPLYSIAIPSHGIRPSTSRLWYKRRYETALWRVRKKVEVEAGQGSSALFSKTPTTGVGEERGLKS